MPGPIVEVTTTLRIYVPLDDCGFALTKVFVKATKLSTSLSLSKDTLPIGACRFALLSTRYSICPALISLTAFSTRSEEHTSELQSRGHLVCRLLLEKK